MWKILLSIMVSLLLGVAPAAAAGGGGKSSKSPPNILQAKFELLDEGEASQEDDKSDKKDAKGKDAKKKDAKGKDAKGKDAKKKDAKGKDAKDSADKGDAANRSLDLPMLAFPSVVNGKVQYYYFVQLRLHAADGEDVWQARERAPLIQDALIRYAHRPDADGLAVNLDKECGDFCNGLVENADHVMGRPFFAKAEFLSSVKQLGH